MPSIFLLPLLLCPLALGLIIARYRIRSADQNQTADCRLQQHLLEHVQHLPRPVVRSFYGPDVSVPTLWLKNHHSVALPKSVEKAPYS